MLWQFAVICLSLFFRNFIAKSDMVLPCSIDVVARQINRCEEYLHRDAQESLGPCSGIRTWFGVFFMHEI